MGGVAVAVVPSDLFLSAPYGPELSRCLAFVRRLTASTVDLLVIASLVDVERQARVETFSSSPSGQGHGVLFRKFRKSRMTKGLLDAARASVRTPS